MEGFLSYLCPKIYLSGIITVESAVIYHIHLSKVQLLKTGLIADEDGFNQFTIIVTASLSQ